MAPRTGSSRINADVPGDLATRARNIAWGERLDLVELVILGLELACQKYEAMETPLVDPNTREIMEKKAGEAYPKRRGELKPGRTVR